MTQAIIDKKITELTQFANAQRGKVEKIDLNGIDRNDPLYKLCKKINNLIGALNERLVTEVLFTPTPKKDSSRKRKFRELNDSYT